MSNEEWERTMAFIVAQQAQFSVDIQLLREAQKETAQNLAQTAQKSAQTEQNLARTEQIVAQTGEIVGRLASVTLAGFKDVNAKIDALVDSQIRSDEKFEASQARSDETFRALADSQVRSDEKLRDFIAGLDRYFKEGRNGE